MLFLIAAAASAPPLVPDGTRLREGDACYAITATKDGATKVIGGTYQSVARKRVGGVDALAIVVHQRLGNGKFDMRDEFLVRRKDLRPISLHNVRNGEVHVHLDYGPSRITGFKVEKGVRTPVSVSTSGPVWDGNLWGLTFAALPLKQGSTFELPMYQYDSGLGAFTGRVTGQETVGSDRAWVVDAGVSKDRRTNYLITADGRELGYGAGPMAQRMSADCSGFPKAAAPEAPPNK